MSRGMPETIVELESCKSMQDKIQPPNFKIQNPKSKIQNRRRRGFTLLEIIVVVTIIALLATLVAPRLLENIWKAKQKVAKSEVASIAQQVALYCADNGLSRPPEDMDLMWLTQGNSPYLRPKDLQDPWGRQYMLLVPGESNPDYDVMTYGGDGQPGGEGDNADVVN